MTKHRVYDLTFHWKIILSDSFPNFWLTYSMYEVKYHYEVGLVKFYLVWYLAWCSQICSEFFQKNLSLIGLCNILWYNILWFLYFFVVLFLYSLHVSYVHSQWNWRWYYYFSQGQQILYSVLLTYDINLLRYDGTL